VAELSGSSAIRQVVRIWARLLAAVVQHWLLLPQVWGDPTKSLSKACEAVRAFASRLASALRNEATLAAVLNDLGHVLLKTCRRNPRSKPGTFELLNPDYSRS
jgi:hypothetical protein